VTPAIIAGDLRFSQFSVFQFRFSQFYRFPSVPPLLSVLQPLNLFPLPNSAASPQNTVLEDRPTISKHYESEPTWPRGSSLPFLGRCRLSRAARRRMFWSSSRQSTVPTRERGCYKMRKPPRERRGHCWSRDARERRLSSSRVWFRRRRTRGSIWWPS
jgi:hypothetical protein